MTTTTTDSPTRRPTRRAEIRAWLLSYLADQLAIDAAGIDPAAEVSVYGVSSITAVGMAGELEDWLDVELSPEFAWDHRTLDAMTDHLGNLLGLEE